MAIALTFPEIAKLAGRFRYNGPSSFRGKGMYRIYFRVFYGSHADDWTDFDVTEDTETLAQAEISRKFNHWLNTSPYAHFSRMKIGVTDD